MKFPLLSFLLLALLSSAAALSSPASHRLRPSPKCGTAMEKDFELTRQVIKFQEDVDLTREVIASFIRRELEDGEQSNELSGTTTPNP